MEEVRRLVERNWSRWEQGIGAVQVQEEDFVLYLMWGIDLVKEQDGDVNGRFRDMVFSALRKKFIRSSFTSNGQDLGYLSDLVCAGVMYCYGLVLTESLGCLQVYDELLKGFGGDWKRIQEIKGKIVADDGLIKDWMVSYMKSGKFYTSKDEVEWAAEGGSEPLIRRNKLSKIDLFRLAIALHEYGAFKSADGDDLPQWKVVQAFGQMLGEDFSGYTNNVGGGTATENPEIFDKLKRAFKKYEDRKLEEKEARK
ncbi:MAG: hypothetical protein J6A22_04605 [Bacteroidales bacterium]|nr:hypothetical protein [Bacteroidales bacterium]